MKKKSAIVFISGGEQQILPISVARNMGYAIVTVDQNPDSPAFTISDEAILLNPYIAQPISDALLPLRSKYDIKTILTRQPGRSVVTAATVADALDIKSVDIIGADSSIHKTKFVRRCSRFGIPAPENFSVTNLNQTDWESINYPAILKPSLALARQQGMRVVENASDLIRKFDIALSAAYDNRVEVESFEEGDDVMLMAVVKEGFLKPVVLLDEITKVDDEGRIRRLAFSMPSVYTDTEREKEILNISRQVIGKFGIVNSPFIISCKVRENDLPVVIDLQLDLGGDKVLDKLFPASTEFDYIRYTIMCLTSDNNADYSPENFTFKPYSVFYNPFHIELEKNYAGVASDDASEILPGRFTRESLNSLNIQLQ